LGGVCRPSIAGDDRGGLIVLTEHQVRRRLLADQERIRHVPVSDEFEHVGEQGEGLTRSALIQRPRRQQFGGVVTVIGQQVPAGDEP
jgi:hypothetical protein